MRIFYLKKCADIASRLGLLDFASSKLEEAIAREIGVYNDYSDVRYKAVFNYISGNRGLTFDKELPTYLFVQLHLRRKNYKVAAKQLENFIFAKAKERHIATQYSSLQDIVKGYAYMSKSTIIQYASCLFLSGEHKDAHQFLQNLFYEHPELKTSKKHFAQCLRMQKLETALRLEMYEEIIHSMDHHQSMFESSFKNRVLEIRAEAFIGLKLYTAAKEAFIKLSEISPSARTYWSLSMLAKIEGNIEDAEMYLFKAKTFGWKEQNNSRNEDF